MKETLKSIGYIVFGILFGWALVYYLACDFIKAIPEDVKIRIYIEDKR